MVSLLTIASLSGRDVEAQALPTLHPRLRGEPYGPVRVRLIRSGWTPGKEPRPGDCTAVIQDPRCFLFPELASCSLTGLGLCRFSWISPEGDPYAVITSGGDPGGDPGVVSDLFRLR